MRGGVDRLMCGGGDGDGAGMYPTWNKYLFNVIIAYALPLPHGLFVNSEHYGFKIVLFGIWRICCWRITLYRDCPVILVVR